MRSWSRGSIRYGIKGDLPEAEKILQTMRDRAARFNAEKIQQKDLASAAGGPPDED